MRRSNREVKDLSAIVDIIRNCDIMHMGMCKDNIPYIVPVNFGFERINDEFIFYFHCASEGKKIDILKSNDNVCLEFECSAALASSDNPMECTYKYKSVIAQGNFEFLQEYSEKNHALSLLMQQYTGKTHSFTQEQVNIVTIGKITVSEITAKQNV